VKVGYADLYTDSPIPWTLASVTIHVQ